MDVLSTSALPRICFLPSQVVATELKVIILYSGCKRFAPLEHAKADLAHSSGKSCDTFIFSMKRLSVFHNYFFVQRMRLV